MPNQSIPNSQTKSNLELDNIPAELRALPRWVLWKSETRDGKPTKVPYQANGVKAESDNPATWKPLSAIFPKISLYDGAGVMLGKGLAGVDLDHHAPEGKLDEYASITVKQLNSYSEMSPSGEGIHILCWGDLPDGRRKNSEKGIEMYSAGRFFTVTGWHITGTPESIERRTDELAQLHRETFPQEKQRTHEPAQPTNLDDVALIEKARMAKNGPKFSMLWDGDISGYGSQSEADLALCCILAFWSGGDQGQMDRLFRQSGLMRPKWNEAHGGDGTTYGNMTINKALQGTHYYIPGQPTRKAKPWHKYKPIDQLSDRQLLRRFRQAKEGRR